MVNGPVQQTPIDDKDFPFVGIFGLPLGTAHILVGEEQVGEERHQGHRCDPAEQQRNQQHPEQGIGVFPCGILGKTNGRERHDGNHRGPQQWPDSLADNIHRRFQFRHAPLHAHQDAFGDHDGVIHQHPQGNNQCAQGNPLQINGQHFHDDKGAKDGEQQDSPHQQTGAHPHEHQQHHDNDGYGLAQVEQEGPHRTVDLFGLVVDRGQLHARRSLILQLGQTLFYPRAHFHHIDALGERNPQGQGRLTIKAVKMIRHLRVAPFNGGHIAQVNQLIRARFGNQQIPHILDGGKFSGGVDADVLVTDSDLTRRVDRILGLQQGKDPFRADAQ